MVKYLFVCGCARSGTTAVTQLLNAHPYIAVGVERYRESLFKGHELSPDDFRKERFFSQSFGHPRVYEHLQQKYDSVVYRGDKIPKLYEYFDQIARNFPEAKIVFIVRNIFDVALSFKVRANDPEDTQWPSRRNVKKAVVEWNRSLQKASYWIKRTSGYVIGYENLMYGKGDNSGLLGYLELESHPDMSQKLRQLRKQVQRLNKERAETLSTTEQNFISLNADFDTYHSIVSVWLPEATEKQ